MRHQENVKVVSNLKVSGSLVLLLVMLAAEALKIRLITDCDCKYGNLT